MAHADPDLSRGSLVEGELKFCHENQADGKLGQAEPPSSTRLLQANSPTEMRTGRKLAGDGRKVLKELKTKRQNTGREMN